jgi:D-threonate/D-erythronate kinase
MALAILADDLTGAADCAARCRGAGLPAAIALRPPVPPFAPGATAFTSDTRHLPPALAAARVRELVAGLRCSADVTWYKKIDSTLRGNLGAELDAVLDALGRDCALVCPAFPAQGRGLSDGWLISSVAQPIHLPTLLAQQARRPVAAVSLADVRAEPSRLAERLVEARHAAQLLAVDALTDEDLRAILVAAEQALPGALLGGSAGLIGALAAYHQETGSKAVADSAASMPAGARALLVVGSGSAAARRQMAYLQQQHQVETIEIDPAAGEPDEERRSQVAGDPHHAVHSSVLGRVPSGWFSVLRDVLLHLPEPQPHATLDGPAARALAGGLAQAALPIIAQLRPALLVLVGGDTAAHVLDGLGVERLEVLREVLPGIPLTQAVEAEGNRRLVILKAGNHGDDAALATLLRLTGIEN